MIHHHNYENLNLNQIIDTFTQKQKMSFNLYCAKDVEHLANDPTIIECNQKIQLWLDGDTSIDLNEIRNIAYNIAINARNNGNYVAYYVSYSSYYSSYSYHASCSSMAKAYNLHPNDEQSRNESLNQFCQEYNQLAQNWLSFWNIPNFPNEPDFPIFDFLQDYNLISYLLPKKEDYYYLNLNGFDIKHIDESELLKTIDTTHIKSILRRIINNGHN